jgi:hypothetical protein
VADLWYCSGICVDRLSKSVKARYQNGQFSGNDMNLNLKSVAHGHALVLAVRYPYY